MKVRIFYVLVGLLFSMTLNAQEQPKTYDYTEIIRINQVRYERALKYNDRAEAKSALYTLTSLEPQNDTLMANLAYLYFEARQYASTVLVCQDVLFINSENAGALEMMAISYENLGLPEKALENYERLYLISDDDPQILYKMAFLQYDAKDFEQCLTNIEILLNKEEVKEISALYQVGEEEMEFSAQVALLNLRGMTYREQGKIEEAKKSFEESLAIAPEFPFAKENLDQLNSVPSDN